LKEGKIKYRTIVGKKAKLLQNQAKTAQKIHGWSPLGKKRGVWIYLFTLYGIVIVITATTRSHHSHNTNKREN